MLPIKIVFSVYCNSKVYSASVFYSLFNFRLFTLGNMWLYDVSVHDFVYIDIAHTGRVNPSMKRDCDKPVIIGSPC